MPPIAHLVNRANAVMITGIHANTGSCRTRRTHGAILLLKYTYICTPNTATTDPQSSRSRLTTVYYRLVCAGVGLHYEKKESQQNL
eukprot:46166-Eustigmatos_ZCMA.PRE.1